VGAALLAYADGTAPPSPQDAAIAALREVTRDYVRLVREINPDYLPGDMTGYPEATEQLEKLGERLEMLSRQATVLAQAGGDWAQLGESVGQLRDDLMQLRGSATPLRAYSYCIRNGIKRPRWAVAQVEAGEFVLPPVHSFQGTFSRQIELVATPGEPLQFQLVAVPINRDVERVEVRLPTGLSGPGSELADLDIACYCAATRSSPLPAEERQFELCPYRLRHCDQSTRLQADLVQPFWFAMTIPEQATPGVYRGRIDFIGREVHALELELRLTISENASE